ncbi:MAG: nitrate reductase subunit beta, partial [Chloroflexota bacterium]
PRLESGQPPACFHSCVGRIRYLGVLLYDADQIEKCASVPDDELVAAQRAMIQDPFDPAVIAAAKKNNISDAMITSAQNSPVYKFVKKWQIALPLHPDFRTLPMLYYVPPMLPVLAKTKDGNYDVDGLDGNHLPAMLSSLDKARMPIKYMASMFSAGNVKVVEDVYRKLIAVRIFKRAQKVSDFTKEEVDAALTQGNTNADEVEAIFRLTSLPTYEERFVVPPLGREVAVEAWEVPLARKQEAGFGVRNKIAKRKF